MDTGQQRLIEAGLPDGCCRLAVKQCLTLCLQIALIIGNLWFVGDTGIRKRVLTLLHQKSATLAFLRLVLKELHDNIGDEGMPPPNLVFLSRRRSAKQTLNIQ